MDTECAQASLLGHEIGNTCGKKSCWSDGGNSWKGSGQDRCRRAERRSRERFDGSECYKKTAKLTSYIFHVYSLQQRIFISCFEAPHSKYVWLLPVDSAAYSFVHLSIASIPFSQRCQGRYFTLLRTNLTHLFPHHSPLAPCNPLNCLRPSLIVIITLPSAARLLFQHFRLRLAPRPHPNPARFGHGRKRARTVLLYLFLRHKPPKMDVDDPELYLHDSRNRRSTNTLCQPHCAPCASVGLLPRR